MTGKHGSVPVFATEAGERAFRKSCDYGGYVDRSKAERIHYASLEPSTRAVSAGLPVDLLQSIEMAANKRDVPCRSLIRGWLSVNVDTA